MAAKRNLTTGRKRHIGEEAERVSLKDCRAANELVAKMRAGEIDPMSLVVEPPRKPLAVVSDD